MTGASVQESTLRKGVNGRVELHEMAELNPEPDPGRRRSIPGHEITQRLDRLAVLTTPAEQAAPMGEEVDGWGQLLVP